MHRAPCTVALSSVILSPSTNNSLAITNNSYSVSIEREEELRHLKFLSLKFNCNPVKFYLRSNDALASFVSGSECGGHSVVGSFESIEGSDHRVVGRLGLELTREQLVILQYSVLNLSYT